MALAEYNKDPIPGPSTQFIVEGGMPHLNGAGELVMEVYPCNGPNSIGCGTIISTSRAILYGTFSATFVSTGVPSCVTSFISVSSSLDEIDLEITGKDQTNANANWWVVEDLDKLMLTSPVVGGTEGVNCWTRTDIT